MSSDLFKKVSKKDWLAKVEKDMQRINDRELPKERDLLKRCLEALENENIGQASYVVPAADGSQQILVLMPDGTTATAILQDPNLIEISAPPTVIEQ